jgi:hypothetical protein
MAASDQDALKRAFLRGCFRGKGLVMILRLMAASTATGAVLGIALMTGCTQHSDAQGGPPAQTQESSNTEKPTVPTKKAVSANQPNSFAPEKEFAEKRIAKLFPDEAAKKEESAAAANAFPHVIARGRMFERALQFANAFQLDEALTTDFKGQIEKALDAPDPVDGPPRESTLEEIKFANPRAWYVGWNEHVLNNALAAPDLQRSGSYKFLGVRQKHFKSAELQTVATFRLILAGGNGVNYHDYLLARIKDKDGKATKEVEAVDVFDYQNGEFLSDAVRRDFILQGGDKLQKGLTADELSFWLDRTNLAEMNTKFDNVDFQGVVAIYRQLQPFVRADVSALILRLRAARTISEPEFRDAIAAFGERGPSSRNPDPALCLLSIDGWLRFRDYTKAKNCVDALDRVFGVPVDANVARNDPYLNILRAGILLAQGENYEEAARLVAQVFGAATEQSNAALGKVAAYQAFEVRRQIAAMPGVSQEVKPSTKDLTKAVEKLELNKAKGFAGYKEDLERARTRYKHSVDEARKEAAAPPRL